jgi:hypothetical protein
MRLEWTQLQAQSFTENPAASEIEPGTFLSVIKNTGHWTVEGIALTSRTSGGCSVCIDRLRTKSHGVCLFVVDKWLATCPAALTPGKKLPVHTQQEAVWVQEPVLRPCRGEDFFRVPVVQHPASSSPKPCFQ